LIHFYKRNYNAYLSYELSLEMLKSCLNCTMLVVLYCCLLLTFSPSVTTLNQANGLNIMGVVGKSVRLPCLAVRRIKADPTLIVWFKGNLTDPMYSLDIRGGGTGSHWSNLQDSQRFSFNLIKTPERLGVLTIAKLRYSDQN